MYNDYGTCVVMCRYSSPRGPPRDHYNAYRPQHLAAPLVRGGMGRSFVSKKDTGRRVSMMFENSSVLTYFFDHLYFSLTEKVPMPTLT